MTAIIFLILLALFVGLFMKRASSDRVWVNGYRRSDGTRVKGHWRRKSK